MMKLHWKQVAGLIVGIALWKVSPDALRVVELAVVAAFGISFWVLHKWGPGARGRVVGLWLTLALCVGPVLPQAQLLTFAQDGDEPALVQQACGFWCSVGAGLVAVAVWEGGKWVYDNCSVSFTAAKGYPHVSCGTT